MIFRVENYSITDAIAYASSSSLELNGATQDLVEDATEYFMRYLNISIVLFGGRSNKNIQYLR